uniref:Sulfotransferase n=1 Tax=Takifugu rubripes TaxID=31033 RepID=A0A674MGH1_TAKRU
MECSWKTVLLLVCASLGVQYTAIRTLRDSVPGPSAIIEVSDKCSPRKHILLFATTRSGSSFTGQLLNQHPEVFYVFEPLYHVQQAFTNSSSRLRRNLDRRALLGAYRDLLLNLYTCDLHFIENYIRPEPQEHVTSSFFRRSSSHALSSPDSPDEAWCPKKCGALNLTLASLSCLSKEHIAIKTVRVPEVGDLRTLTEDPRLDLKIIHLVRDPRAILASRIMAFSEQFRPWKIWNSTGRQPRYVDLSQITSTCKDMTASAETGLQRLAWLRGRYLLVRYEDLAFNPKDKAGEIYRFVGLEMESRVQAWITKNTRSNGSSQSEWNYRYSTNRDSRATAESWRLRLTFDIVKTVQELCTDALSLLGYKKVHSAAELRNLSHSLVEIRTF